MFNSTRLRGAALAVGACALGCLDRPVASPDTRLQSGVSLSIQNNTVDSVDILFEIDNSNSMAQNQAYLARNFAVLIDQLVDPPLDALGVATHPPVKSLHVGVISSDLGTPGSIVPSCDNPDVGDDGLLNPIRNGLAIRSHEPWVAGDTMRPTTCGTDRDRYPSFLSFEADSTDPASFRNDFVCNAYLHKSGCGLEQQLESAYRALVVHNPREAAGNSDPNAGFVRANAILAIVIVSDEEDGSVRDCRYAESGVACTDGVGVFDNASPAWASNDLNLRFYLYQPGSAQDPTWNLDRYIDPRHPNRGFTSLKPGHPENVIFAAITGVPIDLPQTATGAVDFDRLLGTNPDGSDGYTAMSAQGPVSMRQRNTEGDECSARVVPSCRRGGSYNAAHPTCDTAQYFALPSRRIVEVAHRFQASYANGTVSSICRDDYTDALTQIVARIQSHLIGRCLPRTLVTNDHPICCDSAGRPLGCSTGPLCAAAGAVSVSCEVRERLPDSVDAATWCTAAHGRRRAGTDNGRELCLVSQVAVNPGSPAPSGAHGFYYDTTVDPQNVLCSQRITFTADDSIPSGAEATIECVQSDDTSASSRTDGDR